MRYGESRERSAELLRLVVGEMSRHPATLHPGHYALWYEHFAGINPPLSAVVGEKLGAGHRFANEDVEALHGSHIAARDARVSQRLQFELAQLIEQIGRLAAGAVDGASQYGATLARCAEGLRHAATPESISEIVQLLMTHTDGARASTETLVADLGQIRSEVLTLRSEVLTLREEAFADPLTGLANRRGFERAIQVFLADSGLGLTGSSVLFCDIDRFKALNDAHGHLFGDRVLAALGGALKARVKGRDVVARWGGEEFVVFLPETLADDARHLAEQIRQDISRSKIKRIDRSEPIGGVTISIGVAEGAAGEDLASLLERADAAMYQAKADGRNRTVVARWSERPQSRLASVPR